MNNRQCQSQIDEPSKNFNFMKARLVLGIAFALLILSCAIPLHGQVSYLDLYDFSCDAAQGCEPLNLGQLTQGADGNLYGTANQGGSHAYGTIFNLTTSGVDNDVWSFTGVKGLFPAASLTLATDNNFYGTTLQGGMFDQGTIFRLTPDYTFTILHSFNGTDGLTPNAPPVQGPPLKDNPGNLYGVTSNGTTYMVTVPAGKFKQLPNVAPGNTNGLLVLASDGNFYGTTFDGGALGDGTIFRMTTAGAIQTIWNFSGLEGSGPYSLLMQGKDGLLYGTTTEGGAGNAGTVFKVDLAGQLMVSYSFDALNPDGTNNSGAVPLAGLVAASDGYLYGTTSQGGVNGDGTIFQISTSFNFFKVFDFTGFGGSVPGLSPYTTLMQDTNGVLYGLTTGGGSAESGNFFSLTPIKFSQILKVVGPIFVHPGVPVEILGNNLTHAVQVAFGSVQAQFQPGTDNYLSAVVPNNAIDSLITVTLDTGLQIQTQMAVQIVPTITNLDPPSGPVGTQVGIVGGGFNGATKVAFGGVKATKFVVATPSLIQAIVPARAKTGKVVVTTPNGTATSTQTFTVQ